MEKVLTCVELKDGKQLDRMKIGTLFCLHGRFLCMRVKKHAGLWEPNICQGFLMIRELTSSEVGARLSAEVTWRRS